MTHFGKITELLFMSAKYKELTTQLTWKYKNLIQEKAQELKSLQERIAQENFGSHPHFVLLIEQVRTQSAIEAYTQFVEELSE